MRWILIFCVFFFLGCTHTVEPPENLISEQKMAEILSDIYLHQQSGYLTEIQNPQPDFAKIDTQLIESHHATVVSFEESYRFYFLSPEKYNEILIKMREMLEQKLPEKERLKREKEREEAEKVKK